MTGEVRIKIILGVVLTFAIGGIAGFWLGQKIILQENLIALELQNQWIKADNTVIFWRVWQTMNEKYVDKSKIDSKKAVYGAANGMIKSLGDPYSTFFNPSQTKVLLQDIGGSFGGVGMEIGFRQGELTVIAPLEDTPAEKAGIQAGDKIIKVNGEETADLSLEEAVSRIRGEPGTTVTLTVFREGWEEEQDISIVRGIITVTAVRLKLIKPDIIHLKLNNFYENASVEIIQNGVDQGGKKIIIDLRNNTGGLLEKSIEIAGWFLAKGSTVVIQDFGGKRNRQVEYTTGPSTFQNMPLIILVNRGTASAAEILAAALRANRGVKIIGEKTFGKGSVQEVVYYPDGSAVKITTAHWLTPTGEGIEGKGIVPDILIKDKKEGDKDPILEKAIELLR